MKIYEKIPVQSRINIRILVTLLILLVITAIIVSLVNQNNIRRLYEDNFTKRVLLSNSLMANILDSKEVEYYVQMLSELDEEISESQIRFYHDREELFRLKKEDSGQERQKELITGLTEFQRSMDKHKSDVYWDVVSDLRQLKEASNAAYVYVMADTGLVADDGTRLFTYVFDAGDSGDYSSPDIDGLGTCYNVDEDATKAIDEIYKTKKQMDHVKRYDGDYGELYYAYAPIIDYRGEVIAVLGTDLELGTMNREISRAILLFNFVFISFGIIIILFIYFFLSRKVIRPLKHLTGTAQELAKGNAYTPTSETALKQTGEIGILAHAVNDMSLVYQDMINNTANLFDAANVGKLDIRNDESNFKGDIQKVIRQINATLDATTLYLNSIPESIFIMSKHLEIHFKNNNYIQCFGDMSAVSFVSHMFPQSTEDDLSKELSEEIKSNDYVSTVWINGRCFSVIVKEIDLSDTIENSILVIAIDITDLTREKENAQAAAAAKSDFLSSMSHEIRTPMNAIIGMTKIADGTDDVTRLKYCLNTIENSSMHLLGIINDVLDMSKIDAGKFELENVQMNIEKMLMKICNIVIDNMEKKKQKFNVKLSKDLDLNYLADELRLSQVVTNLLSNAIKFTPENGKISLAIELVKQHKNINTLRFSIEDTGIGMSGEQLVRLFNAFEQADKSISRKFGGTGLGLSISKSIVEKMGGRIWAESEPGSGSTFYFEVDLERASHQDTIIFDGIRPENIRLLIIESDIDIRERFSGIVEKFGINTDIAEDIDEAIGFIDAADRGHKEYDIVFLDYDMFESKGFDYVDELNKKIDKNTVVIITTFLAWHLIEDNASQHNITHFITKPLFASSVLDAINSVVGTTLQSLDIKIEKTKPVVDLSGVHILLAEDVDINREIFAALLEETGITIDIADNGLIAVSMFKENHDKYDLIVMDLQMPEMDGYQATKTIREMDIPKAKTIPVIAMTANAFKEDVERCLEVGMNDHLSKPIDEVLVIEKIHSFVK